MSLINSGSSFGGRRAIVIGGSIAGLLTARVLADHFDEVTLLERDPLHDSNEGRKGVPQGRHLHALLARGEQILSELFPDIVAALIEGGATRGDFGRDVRWFHFGAWKQPIDSGMNTIFVSRPFLESHVRRRVAALPNVRLLDERTVTGLSTSADKVSVTGVTVRRASGEEETYPAELTVDAGGRGSPAPRWLEAIGYEPPIETQIAVDVKYATWVFRRPEIPQHDWKALYILNEAPLSRRIGAMMPVEGGRWTVLVAGTLGDHPPSDPEGFFEFAKGLPSPRLHDAIRDLEPIGEIATYRFPANQRRRYDKLARFPEGFAVLGDALCSFNPIYGQGMTTAALTALALGDCLREHAELHRGDIRGLARRFLGRAARVTEIPWRMTIGEDFRDPGVVGERPLGFAALNWYMSCVHRASATDAGVLGPFMRAMHMVGSPAALLDPRTALRVLSSEVARLRR